MISQVNTNDCHNELNTGQCSKREDIKKQRKKMEPREYTIYLPYNLVMSKKEKRKKKYCLTLSPHLTFLL